MTVGTFARRLLGLALGAVALTAGCSGESSPADPNADGSDAAVDAGKSETGVDPADGFCLTRPALPLCEDFDAMPLPGAFAVATGPDAMSIVQDESTSKPASLLITADPAAGASIDARLVSRRLDAGKKLRSLVQVRMPARIPTDDGAPLRLSSFEFPGERAGVAGSYRYSLATNGKGEWFGEELFLPTDGSASTSTVFPASGTVPVDEWTSVRLEVDVLADGTATFSARIGADPVLTPIPMGTPSGLLAPTFSLGLDGATPAASWAVRFDTVTFHFE